MRVEWVDLAILAGLWVWALWGSAMRTPRTIGLLLFASLAYVAAAQFPPAIGIPWRAAVVAGVSWVLLVHPGAFTGLRGEDRAFDEKYHALLDELRRLAEERMQQEVQATAFADRVERIAEQVDQLRAPSPRWSALKDHTVAYLRGEASLYRSMAGSARDRLAMASRDLEMTTLQDEHQNIHSWRASWH